MLFGLRLVGAARAGRRLAGRPTGCCARARSGATATPTRCARPSGDADYAYRLAVDPPAGQGAAAVRPGRLDARPLHRPAHAGCTSCSTRRPGCASGRVAWSLLARRWSPTSLVFWALAAGGARRAASTSAGLVTFAQAAVGASLIAFGGPQLGARRRVGAGGGRAAAAAGDGTGRRAARGDRPAERAAGPRAPLPRRDASPTRARTRPVLDGFDLTIPAGYSLAIVGRNGAGKTTLAKLLCRLYDPQSGAIEVDGVDLRELDRRRRGGRGSPRCSRTSSGSSCRCATTSRRPGRPTTTSWPRSSEPAPPTWPTSTPRWPRATPAAPTCPAGSGSGSRWPGRCARCGWAPGVVLLDEPTAQLDVRGEAEIFDRILAATRGCTTILDLAPVLHRPPRRPDLRARARPGGRARHATTS